jgi:hypothetical protein
MSMVVRVFLVHGGRTLRASVLVFANQSHFNLVIFEKTAVCESRAGQCNLLFRAKIEKRCMAN